MTAPPEFQLHGVDVSTFQQPSLVPQDIDFAIVRAAFGKTKDSRTISHVNALRARDVPPKLGLYTFFVPGHPVPEQLRAFLEQADACQIGDDDILPHIDIEDPSGGTKYPPNPSWCDGLLELAMGIDEAFGGCGVYLTQRDFGRLGKPQWILARPLWVAHYPYGPPFSGPATPGRMPAWCWQYAVGPWTPRQWNTPHGWESLLAIDHDAVMTEIPLISSGAKPEPVEPEDADDMTDEEEAVIKRARARVACFSLTDEDWDAMRAERDAAIAEDDEP